MDWNAESCSCDLQRLVVIAFHVSTVRRDYPVASVCGSRLKKNKIDKRHVRKGITPFGVTLINVTVRSRSGFPANQVK